MWLFGVASVRKHNIFKAHPYCKIYQYFIPFYDQIIFHCMYTHNLFIHSSTDGHLDLLGLGTSI